LDHLKRIHKIPAKVRRQYEAYTKSLQIVGADNVSTPASGSPPVAGLKVHDGVVCRRCGYISQSENWIKQHLNEEHQWVKKDGTQWDIRHIQTFFTNNKTRYFVVAGPTKETLQIAPAGDVDGMVRALLDRQEQREQEEDRERGKAEEDQLKSDNTPWLRRNGWLRKFAGKNILKIAEFSRQPIKEEGALREVCKSIDRVFGNCKKSIAECREDG
jgi:hypothetical protein